MDPLTHSLFGAALARTPAAARVPLALPALILAANLPDVDVFSYVRGGDVALAFRRGWTHGPIGLALLPLVLSLAMFWWARRRQGPTTLRSLVVLCYIGTLSHPLLDWLNTYGVRFLMPFDAKWFYGDALFIVDPWMWLLLGGGLYLAGSSSRARNSAWICAAALATLLFWRALPADQVPLKIVWILAVAAVTALRWFPLSARFVSQVPSIALVTFGVYALAMVGSSRLARRHVAHQLALSPAQEARVLVSPRPATPFAKDIVAVTDRGYEVGEFSWIGTPAFRVVGEPRAVPVLDERFEKALRDPCIRGFAAWARFPMASYTKTPDGWQVNLADLRYAGEGSRGFGTASVEVEDR